MAKNSIAVKPVVSLDRVMEVLEDSPEYGRNVGFCLACGEETDGVEPDARGYVCESCGARKVYGAEEALLMLA